jgi:formylglycine-generating enzyme required for sulfatase activity
MKFHFRPQWRLGWTLALLLAGTTTSLPLQPTFLVVTPQAPAAHTPTAQAAAASQTVPPATKTLPAPSAPDAPPQILPDGIYGLPYGDILLPEMVRIPEGDFNMGQANPHLDCYDCDKDEQPVHKVMLSGFEIGRFEVTNAQYKTFAEATGRSSAEWRQYYKPGKENFPVLNVSWADAQAYCAWLQAETGRSYRLPTEAEWEYAARAGTQNAFIHGNKLSHREAHFDNKDGPGRIGRFKPNRFGLYDTLGNVWEWCADWYGEDYYQKSPDKNPQGPTTGQYRVLRGGSWLSTKQLCRVANRSWYNPGYILDGRGFRIVATD